MASPIAVDTPDYQRGVVSAQVNLGEIPAGQSKLVTGIPSNAETLVVAFTTTTDAAYVTVTGNQTGTAYQGARIKPQAAFSGWQTWLFDISSVLDETVTIVLEGSDGGGAQVYADSGVHVVADTTKLLNQSGQQYVIPSVPSIFTGDHPPNEMQCTFDFGTTTQVFMGAPGVGLRYRLFTLELTGDNASGSWEMVASGNVDGPYIHVAGVNATVIPLHPQGYPMPTNTGLTVTQDTAGGTWRGTVWHTIETV